MNLFSLKKCGKNTITMRIKPQSLRRGGKQALISEWNINYSCLKLHRAQTFPQNDGKRSHCLVQLIRRFDYKLVNNYEP
jgi:hypothetical protein